MSSPSPSTTPHWVGSWAAAVQPVDSDEPAPAVADVTFREVVHTSLGGPRIRLRLSNAYGKTPVALGSVHVALHGKGSAILPASDREVRFHGSKSVAIPVGQTRTSDAIELTVPAFTDVAISFYIAAPGVITTVHETAQSTSYTATGDQTDAPELPVGSTSTTTWHVIAGLDVDAPADATAVVTFGDSITDGLGSTVDANHRWPDRLAERLGESRRGVVNAGISGNALLGEVAGDPGLARFDRDVLGQASVGSVIVAIGINDVLSFDSSPGKSVDEVIAGYRKLIAKLHAASKRAVFATLLPVGGSRFFTPAVDATRARINDWLRSTTEVDGLIDFDKVVRDPGEPTRIAPTLDSGDHIHPSDAGYRAMGDAIDLARLR